MWRRTRMGPVLRRCASGPPLPPEAEATADLYVRNLPVTATADDVRRAFEACCTVRHVQSPVHRATGAPRGYTVVTVAADAAEFALEAMSGAAMGSRLLRVALVDAAKARRHAASLAERAKLACPEETVEEAPRPEPWRSGPAARGGAGGGPVAELLVRNVARGATAADVRGAFSAVCAVRSVIMPSDRWTKKPRGFAFVTIEAKDADVPAMVCVMDGFSLCGVRIGVRVRKVPFKPRRATAEKPRWEKSRHPSAAEISLNKRLVSSDAAAVLALVDAETAWSPVNLATALHRLGALGPFSGPPPPLLSTLVERTATSMKVDAARWESRQLANACWGVAKIGNVDAPTLFEAVAAVARAKIATFSPQALASTVWAFATAGVAPPALFEAVAAEASMKMVAFNSQELANTLWAFATAGADALALFEAVAAEVSKKIATFKPQELANTAWAFSTAKIEAPALFELVAAESVKKIAMFSPQNLANTVWAYATAMAEAPLLFKAVAAESVKMITVFTPQGLSNTVWAFATARVEAPLLFEAVAAEARHRVAAFSSQALANTVWAFSTAGVKASALFEAVAAESSKKIVTFNPQALANTVWAYATAGATEAHRPLFEAVAAEASTKIATFDSQELVNTAWSFATAGVDAPALFEAVASKLRIGECSYEGLAQLHRVYVHLRLEAPRHSLTVLLSRHEAELQVAGLRQEPASRAQCDVSAALWRIGWDHDAPHFTAEGLSLGMAQPASKVAVEFYGPTHYLAGYTDGVTHVLDGPTKAKERLLRRLGWKVVRVAYFEWKQLRTSADQQACLRGKLAF